MYTFAGGRFRFCSACALFFAESVAYFRGRPHIDVSYKNELKCKSKSEKKHVCKTVNTAWMGVKADLATSHNHPLSRD